MSDDERNRIATLAGRRRGDEVCRVPGSDRAASLGILRDLIRDADGEIEDAYAMAAHAMGKRERLVERLRIEDVEPLPEVDPLVAQYGLAIDAGRVPLPKAEDGWSYAEDWPRDRSITHRDGARFVLHQYLGWQVDR